MNNNILIAALHYFENNLDVTVRTVEDDERINEIEEQLNNNEGGDTDSLQEELEELESKVGYDNLEFIGSYFDLERIKLDHLDYPYYEIAVGEYSDAENSAVEWVKEYIDDSGGEINEKFAEDYIDAEMVSSLARDFYSDDVYSEPSAYLDEDEDKVHSGEQINDMNDIQSKLDEMNELLERVLKYQSEVKDDVLYDKLEKRASKIESIIYKLETKYAEIESEPELFDENKMDEKIDELVENAENNPLDYLRDFGFEIKNYIDMDAYCKGVVESDGLGILSGYDGDYEIETVGGIDYYIFRLE